VLFTQAVLVRFLPSQRTLIWTTNKNWWISNDNDDDDCILNLGSCWSKVHYWVLQKPAGKIIIGRGKERRLALRPAKRVHFSLGRSLFLWTSPDSDLEAQQVSVGGNGSWVGWVWVAAARGCKQSTYRDHNHLQMGYRVSIRV